jgi:hypothetical protein
MKTSHAERVTQLGAERRVVPSRAFVRQFVLKMSAVVVDAKLKP